MKTLILSVTLALAATIAGQAQAQMPGSIPDTQLEAQRAAAARASEAQAAQMQAAQIQADAQVRVAEIQAQAQLQIAQAQAQAQAEAQAAYAQARAAYLKQLRRQLFWQALSNFGYALQNASRPAPMVTCTTMPFGVGTTTTCH
jgi:hypothetical protein